MTQGDPKALWNRLEELILAQKKALDQEDYEQLNELLSESRACMTLLERWSDKNSDPELKEKAAGLQRQQQDMLKDMQRRYDEIKLQLEQTWKQKADLQNQKRIVQSYFPTGAGAAFFNKTL